MRYSPKSEQELQEQNLILKGIYQFQVIESEDTVSKAGNEMIKLRLKLWDNEGNERTVYDYLTEAMLYKLKHFCDIVGLVDKYEAGTLHADDCMYKMGRVSIDIQKGNANPNGGMYPDKNVVKDYVVAPASSVNVPLTPANKVDPELDDEIPF